MRQVLANIGLIALLAASNAAASPSLRGAFRGEIGTVEFEAEDGRVKARALQGPCGFDPSRVILDAQFEGTVLVGRIFLCQQGPQCGEDSFPFLGFYNADDRALSAYVKLSEGCTSPALKDNRFSLRAIPAEDPGAGSAAEIAKRNSNPKQAEQLALAAFTTAGKLFENEDYAAAKQQFLRAVSYYDKSADAFLGLGACEFYLGNMSAAIEAYQRSLAIDGENSYTHYNLAVAYARLKKSELALEALQKAANHGFPEPDLVRREKELVDLLADTPGFKSVMKTIETRAQKRQTRRPSP